MFPVLVFLFLNLFLLHLFHHLFILGVHTCLGTRVEIRGQFVGISCRLPAYGFCGSNSGHRVWQHAPLPTKPSCQPIMFILSSYIIMGFLMTFSHIYACIFILFTGCYCLVPVPPPQSSSFRVLPLLLSCF